MNLQSRVLNQVKIDFENTKKRVYLAQSMKAAGYAEKEILEALEEAKQPDIVDLYLEALDN